MSVENECVRGQNGRIRQGKRSVLARSKNAHKCSQHAHKWSQTFQIPGKWPKKTLTLLGRSQHAHSNVLERSLSFKFIQSHSKSVNFLHLSPDWCLTGYHSMSFKVSPVKLPQVDSNRSNFHHHLLVKFTKIFILTI